MRILTAALLAGALTVAVACGDSGGGGAPAPQPMSESPPAKPAGSKFTIDYINPGFDPVQVEVLQAGTGPIAGVGADVVIHYTANAQGKDPYASSRQAGHEPMKTTVGVGKPGLVPGWDVALTHMRVGDHWKLTIPSDLAYGPNGGPKVPPNSVLEVDVEMLEITGRP